VPSPARERGTCDRSRGQLARERRIDENEIYKSGDTEVDRSARAWLHICRGLSLWRDFWPLYINFRTSGWTARRSLSTPSPVATGDNDRFPIKQTSPPIPSSSVSINEVETIQQVGSLQIKSVKQGYPETPGQTPTAALRNLGEKCAHLSTRPRASDVSKDPAHAALRCPGSRSLKSFQVPYGHS